MSFARVTKTTLRLSMKAYVTTVALAMVLSPLSPAFVQKAHARPPNGLHQVVPIMLRATLRTSTGVTQHSHADMHTTRREVRIARGGRQFLVLQTHPSHHRQVMGHTSYI
jgi:hypothetical protein